MTLLVASVFSSIWHTILGLMVIVTVIAGWKEGRRRSRQQALAPKQKRYVMRGYGGGPNTTSLHPRQAAKGKRIVFIPGVGYRHVQATKPKPRRKPKPQIPATDLAAIKEALRRLEERK